MIKNGTMTLIIFIGATISGYFLYKKLKKDKGDVSMKPIQFKK